MPEYALAVDLYRGDALWVHVQEYAPPASVDPTVAARRRQEGLETIAQVLEVGAGQIFFKERRRQRGRAQYVKLNNGAQFWPVREGDCTLLVNFEDYLDTGLFLDQRTTRARIGTMAAGKLLSQPLWLHG